jgi:hypothetical protein
VNGPGGSGPVVVHPYSSSVHSVLSVLFIPFTMSSSHSVLLAESLVQILKREAVDRAAEVASLNLQIDEANEARNTISEVSEIRRQELVALRKQVADKTALIEQMQSNPPTFAAAVAPLPMHNGTMAHVLMKLTYYGFTPAFSYLRMNYFKEPHQFEWKDAHGPGEGRYCTIVHNAEAVYYDHTTHSHRIVRKPLCYHVFFNEVGGKQMYTHITMMGADRSTPIRIVSFCS